MNIIPRAYAITTPYRPFENLTFGDVLGILNLLASWMFTILLVVAVIVIIIAAFKYLTSGGDPDKVKSATQMLIWAVVGVGVAILVYGIINIVTQLVGGR